MLLHKLLNVLPKPTHSPPLPVWSLDLALVDVLSFMGGIFCCFSLQSLSHFSLSSPFSQSSDFTGFKASSVYKMGQSEGQDFAGRVATQAASVSAIWFQPYRCIFVLFSPLWIPSLQYRLQIVHGVDYLAELVVVSPFQFAIFLGASMPFPFFPPSSSLFSPLSVQHNTHQFPPLPFIFHPHSCSLEPAPARQPSPPRRSALPSTVSVALVVSSSESAKRRPTETSRSSA